MDPDTLYRMIVSLGPAILIIIIAGILWPRKQPQNHCDTPLSRLLNKSSTVNQEATENPLPSTDKLEISNECPLCEVNTIDPLNPHLSGLDRIIATHHGKTNCYELAEMILLFYKQNINHATSANIETICLHINGDHSLLTQ